MKLHTEREIQARLVDTGDLPRYAPDGKPNIDGDFGERTLIAYNRFRSRIPKGPVSEADPLEVEADLWPPAPKPPSVIDILRTANAVNKGDFSMIPASAIDYLLNFLQSKIVWATGILVIAVDTFVSTHWGLNLPADVNAWITTGLVTVGGVVIAWLRTFFNKPKVVSGQVVAK